MDRNEVYVFSTTYSLRCLTVLNRAGRRELPTSGTRGGIFRRSFTPVPSANNPSGPESCRLLLVSSQPKPPTIHDSRHLPIRAGTNRRQPPGA